MNRYMVLLWGGGPKLARMSQDEVKAHLGRWTEWMEALSAKGIWDGGEPLGAEAKVLKGPAATVTDGPYTEAKEAVSGYVILKTDTIEEAAEISRGCPLFEIDGVVEVRPIGSMRAM